jgi:hypothetical protein
MAAINLQHVGLIMSVHLPSYVIKLVIDVMSLEAV